MREFYRDKKFLPSALSLLFIVVLAAHYWTILPHGNIKGTDEYITLDRSHSFVLRGDPFTVYSNNRPSFKKPPLQYWMSASLMRQGADLEFALRFPSYVFGLLTLISAGVLAYLLYPSNPWVAPATIALLAGSLSVWKVAISAYLDSGAMLFTTVAIIGCLLALSRPKWWYLVALAVGLAALQKAPTPLLLVGGILVLSFVFTKWHQIDLKAALLNRHFAAAAVLTVLALSFWPALQWLRFGPESFREAYVDEMMNRFSMVADQNLNRRSWRLKFFDGEWLLRIPAILALLAMPWVLRRMDLLSLPLLYIAFVAAALLATGHIPSRYALLFMPLMMAALAIVIIEVVPGRILPACIIAALAVSQGGPVRNARALGIPNQERSQHVELLRNISKTLRPEETFLVCFPPPKGQHMNLAAISYYASNGKPFFEIDSPDTFAKLQREKRIAPPYRGLCHDEGLQRLKSALGDSLLIVEESEDYVHWTAR